MERLSNHEGQFPCLVVLSGPSRRVLYRRMVEFPLEALHPHGKVTTLTFPLTEEKVHGPEAVATCVVPETDAALEILNRRMHVHLEAPNLAGTVSIMSTSEPCFRPENLGGYYCDWGVVGVGQRSNGCSMSAFDPTCPDPYFYCQFNPYSYGCFQSPCFSNNTLDLCRDPCYVYNNCTVSFTPEVPRPFANDEATACHLASSNNCNMLPATAAQREKARTLMHNVRDEEICGQAKAVVLDVVNDANNPERFQIWTNEVTQDGKVILGDHGWFYTDPAGFSRIPTIHIYDSYDGFSAWTLTHEALHGLGKDHGDFLLNPDGRMRSMDDTAMYCARAG
jgi:hypothetical protein